MVTYSSSAIRGAISFILVFFVFFYGLGDVGLFHNNEGLYGQIAREMANGGSMIIPTMKGVPYIEKPPLLYWLTALFYRLFGVQEWTARLVPALSGLCCVGICYGAVRAFVGARPAHVAALMVSSSVGFLIFSRMLYFDGLFTVCMTATLFAFFAWIKEQGIRWMRVSYGFLAISCLAKGFLALILGFLTVLPFLIYFYKRDKPSLRRFFDPVGILIFFGVLLPWHIMACFEDPGFAYFYFINEHVLRFLGLRLPKDYYSGSVFYYIHRLFLYLFPWSLILLAPMINGCRMKTVRSFFRTSFWDFIFSFPGFCLWWAGVFFVFFSLSRAKANYYIMTILPPLMCVMGCFVHKIWKDDHRRALIQRSIGIFLWGMPLLFALCALMIPQIRPYFWPLKWHDLAFDFPVIPMASWFLMVGFFWTQRGPKTSLDGAQMTLFTVSMIVVMGTGILKQNEDVVSARPLMADFNRTVSGPYTAILYRDVEKMSSVPFYLTHIRDARSLLLLDSASNDIMYGCGVDPKRGGCISGLDVKNLSGSLFFFVYKEQWGNFEAEFPNARLWARRGAVSIYSVFSNTTGIHINQAR